MSGSKFIPTRLKSVTRQTKLILDGNEQYPLLVVSVKQPSNLKEGETFAADLTDVAISIVPEMTDDLLIVLMEVIVQEYQRTKEPPAVT